MVAHGNGGQPKLLAQLIDGGLTTVLKNVQDTFTSGLHGLAPFAFARSGRILARPE